MKIPISDRLIVFLLLLFFLLSGLTGYFLIPSLIPSKPSTVETLKTQPLKISVPTLDQKFDAIFRADQTTKVCFDSTLQAFFKYYPPGLLKDDKGNQSEWIGWFIVNEMEFKTISNNTLIIVKDGYVKKIYPDVTGLPCKE